MKLSGWIAGIVILVMVIPLVASNEIGAEIVPEWIKNTAKWFGEDKISEREFLDAIKFLIENDIIVLDTKSKVSSDTMEAKTTYVIIPNGNSLQGNTGFYIPLKLEVKTGTTVIWLNDDVYSHTVQSQDENGKPLGLFNSNVLKTGDTYSYQFNEPGDYPYYCTLHPWRVGIVTVS